MRGTYWLLLALLGAANASAQVYKWVDPQGDVHYSDQRPDTSAAEPVQLPGLSTIEGRPVPPPAPEPEPQPQAFTGYDRVRIVEPAPDSAVRGNDQRVEVTVALEPQLQEGHAVLVLLDGTPAGEPYPGTRLELTGVYRGKHSLQARVLDANGQVLAESSPISFTLRQHSILAPAPPRPPVR